MGRRRNGRRITTGVGAALLGVVAQRLVRKICENCRTEWTPSEAFMKELFGGPSPAMPWYRGKGCDRCHFTGYSGRMLVGELWVPSDNDVLLINKGAPFDEIVARRLMEKARLCDPHEPEHDGRRRERAQQRRAQRGTARRRRLAASWT